MRYFQAEKPELGSNKIVYNSTRINNSTPQTSSMRGFFLYMLDNFIQILAANRFVDVY